MSYDREQFIASIAAKREENQRSVLPQANAVRAAAVSMGLLTGNEHWDRFLSLLQAMRESVDARKRDALLKIDDPALSDQAVRKLRMDMREAGGMLSALDAVMQLPKALHDGGEKAQEVIMKFENDRSPAPETTQS